MKINKDLLINREPSQMFRCPDCGATCFVDDVKEEKRCPIENKVFDAKDNAGYTLGNEKENHRPADDPKPPTRRKHSDPAKA